MSKLYGLVVCGGKSTRMGTDKSLLEYHGQPQRYHLYDMVVPLCERVFISCNEQQATTVPNNYDLIVDMEKYQDAGPMTAVLSAFKAHPNVDFLVVGCDYPLLKKGELQQLLKVSLQTINSAAFYNKEVHAYEPLLAIYQSVIADKLENNFRLSKRSLSRLLEEIAATKVIPNDQDTITSVDTWEDYLQTKRKIETLGLF